MNAIFFRIHLRAIEIRMDIKGKMQCVFPSTRFFSFANRIQRQKGKRYLFNFFERTRLIACSLCVI